MSMRAIRATYQLPIKRGVEVLYGGILMRVLGTKGEWLKCQIIDSPNMGHRTLLHPCWDIKFVRRYFDCTVTVYKVKATWHPYPWRFTVEHEGETHRYEGLPNQCATAHSALRRAWWRAKWFNEGIYDKKYLAMGGA